MLTVAEKNVAMDALAARIPYLSLHTAFPGTGGSNEVAGGAYARKATAWSPAASSKVQLSGSIVFDVPAGTTVAWLGYQSAASAGTYRGCMPLGGAPKEFTVDPATDTFRCEGHGYADGQTVVFFGGSCPTGLTEGSVYYVRDAATDTFKVSATNGGSAIDITGVGDVDVVVSKITPETFGAAGTYTLTAGSLELFP